MRVRIAVLVVLLLLVTTSLDPAIADKNRPVIRIYEPPSRSFPLKVYVYSTAIDLDINREFTCEAGSKIKELFYDVLRTFPKVVSRFVDEYPEYRRLALIYFENASTPSEAAITFRIIRERKEPSVAYTVLWEKRAEIYVKCELLEWSFNVTEDEAKVDNLAWSVLAHELGHALGSGHAGKMYTDDGHPELMYFGGFGDEKVYYSTLDLYALYIAYFGDSEYHEGYINITLPSDIEYKMVIPYDVEIQKLRTENRWLWEKLEDANDLISYFQNENERLRGENERLRAEHDSLMSKYQELEAENRELMEKWRGCEAMVKDLVRYADRLEEKNRAIKTQYDKLLNASLTLYGEYNKTRDRLINLTNRYNDLVERYNELLEAYDEAFEGRRTCALMLAVVAVTLSSLYFWQYWKYTRLERELERLRG